MGSFSLMHWLIVLAVVLIFFGTGRIANVMKEVGKGVRGFKDGISGTDEKDKSERQLPPKE